jgi:ribonuclease BN (tRNA processing enzyme)
MTRQAIKAAVGALGVVLVSGPVWGASETGAMTAARRGDTVSARVVLLGTGTPIPDPERSGPSLAIVVGGASYLVDAGPGVVRRATAAAVRDLMPALRVANLRYVFITHLHSDHTLGLPDLMLTPAVMHRKAPLTVYGPVGTRAMAAKLLEAYHEDITLRIHGLERGDSNAYRVIVHEVKPGIVYRDSNVTVTAFSVPHGSWRAAFGYRFDARDRSIVVSGDTRLTDAMITACHGCDVLVHEVYSKRGFDRLDSASRRYHSTFHTSAIELGDLATRAQPKLLLLSHILFFGESGDEILGEVRSRFVGQVALGADFGVY